VIVPGNDCLISLTSMIREFYGSYGDQAASAYANDPTKYETRFLPEGLIAYELTGFDSISIKLLVGDLRTIRDLIHPLRNCNLTIKVPQELSDYIFDLQEVGFKIQGGKNLLLLNKLGNFNG